MKNLFDKKNYPEREPRELTVGTTWAWRRTDLDQSYSTEKFEAVYHFCSLSSVGARFSVGGMAEEGEFIFVAAPSVTTKYAHGKYLFQLVLTRKSDGAKVVYEEGDITLKHDLSVDSGDVRSHARKLLDAIKATLEKTATKEQQSYSIAGRSLSRRTVDELLKLKSHYARIVKNEERAAARKAGKPKPLAKRIKLSGR